MTGSGGVGGWTQDHGRGVAVFIEDKVPRKSMADHVIRLEAPDGGETTLFTSLDALEFSRKDLRELHHLWWEADEFYELLRSPCSVQRRLRSKSPGE